ncbi:hypothetical protein CLV62_11213 [Dysgonomonas alginatilytica]|uniref:Uncharacterized protein n=1 Tax=Dysgonomonas alginatilytica TaxID=1605892 RepID=A0A2V3PNT7_9BACT|nr:type VI secretion system baseplate subunit TssF [Dysgonomonas alginatilytica]PXV63764.1 hypothetical protein CLV62_11213 [Dysgonomonas alginatilytica]
MNTGNTQYTKRNILKRMQKFAVILLGVKSVKELDPMVLLFIQSLAEEVYKLAGQINSIESRLLEKLSGILIPDMYISPRPAHAILHASPLERSCLLTQESGFFIDKYQHKDGVLNKQSFYPVCNTLLKKGGIRYIIINGLLHSTDTDSSKTLICHPDRSENTDANTCWIGLELDSSIPNLKNLSFYFDFPYIENKKEYLGLLPYLRWSLNGTPLKIEQGLYTIPSEYNNKDIALFSNSALDLSHTVNESILSFYHRQFITVADDTDINSCRQAFPENLKVFYPQSITSDISKPLVWLEIKFPSAFSTAVIEQMTININAFPVANKRLCTLNTGVNEFSQVVPLRTDNNESFLFVQSLTDTKGREYYELPFKNTPQKEYRSYSLRRGGIERYDSRDAKEFLINLTNRMQSRATFLTDKSDNDEDSKEIQQQIQLLVNYLKKETQEYKDSREPGTYIITDCIDNDEVLFVKYWATNCEKVNGIRNGTVLESNSGLEFDSSSIRLLTTTAGGKSAPRSAAKTSMLRQTLLSRTVLVTNNDIKKYCLSEFRDTVSKVRISKGYMEYPGQEYSFLRTIDVYLTPHKRLNKLFHQQDTEFIRQKLVKHSPATYYYRILIEE